VGRSGTYSDRSSFNLPAPDYEAEDVLVVRATEQFRALGDDLRTQIVVLLRDHAASTTELAEKLGLPKGTVGHHLKVLEKAGLVRVVRTRKVRAVTENYFGRTARLFVFKSTGADGEDVRNVAAASLRRAAEELLPIGDDARTTFAVVRARLTDADAKRLTKRLERLIDDFRAAEAKSGREYGFAAALYERMPDA
jgi:DNA-binding transcriptional ArsR family regulator